MDKIKEIREKIDKLGTELATMKALLETEKRSGTTEEVLKANTIMDEMESLDKEIENIEMNSRMTDTMTRMRESRREAIKPDVTNRSVEKREFRSFGEQLLAVMTAGSPGGSLDRRLIPSWQGRAATGMSESIPSDGGFLVQTDFASTLLQRVYTPSGIPAKCSKIPISGSANGLKVNANAETSRVTGSRWGGIVGYWLNEAGTKTASAPKFRQMELSLKKLIGLCYATDELLQDAAALESVISQGFASEFDFLITDAIIRGTGVGQPLGFMTSPCLVSVTRSATTVVTAVDVINMWARGYAKSRTNMVWLINQDVEPQLFKMSINTGTASASGQLVYMAPGGLSVSPYGTLFGRPVIPIEQCQTLGTTSDIILADFSEYLLIDKGGIQSASSIHVSFLTDQSVFRFVYRVDGQPTWNNVLTPFKGSNTQSPFVVLTTV